MSKKLGINFSTFTIAPSKEHIEGTRVEGTNFFVVKATKKATWVKLITNNPEDFVEGEDYLILNQNKDECT